MALTAAAADLCTLLIHSLCTLVLTSITAGSRTPGMLQLPDDGVYSSDEHRISGAVTLRCAADQGCIVSAHVPALMVTNVPGPC